MDKKIDYIEYIEKEEGKTYAEILEENEKKEKAEILEAIENDCLLDFISNNYYRLENYVLIELLQECIYILTTCNGYEDNQKQLIDNLKEYRDF